MDIEMDGSNETLLEGIRQIATAMQSRAVVKHVGSAGAPKVLTNGNGASAPDQADVTELELSQDEHDGSDSAGVSQEVEAPVAPKPRAPRSAPKAPPLSEGLEVLTGAMSLPEFCAGLNITKDSPISDKAIVIATWLKENRARPQMDASDLYTCCKAMDWSPPIDMTSPMRNLKRDDKLASKERGKFELTMLGEKHFRELKK
jgi:hypothetical protein